MIGSQREVIIRRKEFFIPSGCAVGELDNVQAYAQVEYRQRRGLTDNAPLPMEWARIESRDDEVVLVVEAEEEPRDADQRLRQARDALAELLARGVSCSGSGPDGRGVEADFAGLQRALWEVQP